MSAFFDAARCGSRLALLVAGLLSTGCGAPSGSTVALAPSGSVQVRSVQALDWTPLNAARGDASPMAATLWGDRAKAAPTGFLVRFKKGFASPPHIHNVSYRAVVIRGLVHNASPEAPNAWMGPGSFWTQPKGASHITSASGTENVALVEIDSGPYLVRPTQQAFETDEAAINVHRSNVVYSDLTDLRWVAQKGAQIALLWGDPLAEAPGGVFVKMASGSERVIVSGTERLDGIAVTGLLNVGETQGLAAGGHFQSSGSVALSCAAGNTPCVVYIRSGGKLTLGAAGQ